MAKLTVMPPPEQRNRTFTLVLNDEEAMCVWAALGTSSPIKRWDWFEANAICQYSKDIDLGYNVFLLLNDIFGQPIGQSK